MPTSENCDVIAVRLDRFLLLSVAGNRYAWKSVSSLSRSLHSLTRAQASAGRFNDS